MGTLADFMKQFQGVSTLNDITPYVPSTKASFAPYVPPQLEADFDAYLMTDVPHSNWWFLRRVDWYDEEKQDQIRGEIFPINWKSKYSGSDTASNFRVSQKTAIQKGDVLIREDGEIFMVIWDVENQVNNKKSQVQICNLMTSFDRFQKAKVDANGKLIEAEGRKVVAENLPVIAYEIANKQEFTLSYNMPGIVPNHIGTVLVQYNTQTANLKIGDEFMWHKTRFHITDIGYGELDMNGTFGMLTLYVEKTAGEEHG